jgi:hypothetical protein
MKQCKNEKLKIKRRIIAYNVLKKKKRIHGHDHQSKQQQCHTSKEDEFITYMQNEQKNKVTKEIMKNPINKK